MEVIECDRCKKRIGEKAGLGDDATTPVKVGKVAARTICAECAGKLESFMRGADDLRTERCQVHPGTIRGALFEAFPTSMKDIPELSLSSGIDKIIAALPNGGEF